LEAFKQLKKHAVVVYVNTEKPKSKESLSPVVIGVLNASSMGNIIPKAVVTSPDQLTYMASMPYKSMKDSKAFRAANTKVKAALAGQSMEAPKDAKFAWTIAGSGRFYKGDFVELKDDKDLVLKSPEGKPFNVPMAKLTSGAQAYARHLAGGGEEKPAEKLEMEPWESAKGGKTIHATFLSLKGEKITLKKQDGKLASFSISLLSEKSQQRAKELAAK
jgi:hypothetical protein